MYIINRDKLYKLKGKDSTYQMAKKVGIEVKMLQSILAGKNKMMASQSLLKICYYYGIVDVRMILIKI